MSSAEKRLKEAFDAITLPPDLRDSTLRLIEAERQASSRHRSAPEERRRRSASVRKRLGFALAACLALVALCFGGFTAYAAETASVSIELNPSIELGINRFDTVVAVRAIDEDGQYVLEGMDLVGKSYREAATLIMGSERFLSFIEGDSFVDVSVACDDAAQARILIAQSDKSLLALPCAGACKQASSQVYEDARRAGMGVARYEAASYLVELDPTIRFDEAQSMTMAELRSRIAEIDPESVYAQGGHGGHGRSQSGPQGSGQGHQGSSRKNC